MQTWADIKFVGRAPKDGRWTLEKPLAEVRAAQFEWRFAYPGADGVLGTIDVVETPFELVVPVDADVVLRLVSRDVIHSFFVPQFRLKQDVVPGRYTRLWFTATQVGEFALFCSEYCGSDHSQMTGRVVVMTPADYARWLASGPAQPSMAQYGFALFRQLGCSGCHDARSTIHAPLLDGIYGRTVHLQDGRSVVADANYLRDSILLPAKDIVAGFAPVMPSFAGQVSEEDLQALIAYLQSTSQRDAP